MIRHVQHLHRFYGEVQGVRIARKHIAWYCKQQHNANAFRAVINRVEESEEQIEVIKNYFEGQQTLAA